MIEKVDTCVHPLSKLNPLIPLTIMAVAIIAITIMIIIIKKGTKR